MKMHAWVRFFENKVPSRWAEGWDNVGFLLGRHEKEIQRVMLCLDVTSAVIEEAVNKQIDLLITHHPLIFKPMSHITDADMKGKLIWELVQKDLCVFTMHTNLDIAKGGVNDYLAHKLNLQDLQNMGKVKLEKQWKITVYVPGSNAEAVRSAMCDQGAGLIGNYSDCSFATKGVGTFKPLEGSCPTEGNLQQLSRVDEQKLELVVGAGNLYSVIEAMKQAHPYEEVAYEASVFEKPDEARSFGRVGVLEKEMDFQAFVLYVKENLGVDHFRVVGKKKTVKKVAVFGGSFDKDLMAFKKSGADVLITGDITYHTAMDALEEGLCIFDCGHFNTEVLVLEALSSWVKEADEQVWVCQSERVYDPFQFV